MPVYQIPAADTRETDVLAEAPQMVVEPNNSIFLSPFFQYFDISDDFQFLMTSDQPSKAKLATLTFVTPVPTYEFFSYSYSTPFGSAPQIAFAYGTTPNRGSFIAYGQLPSGECAIQTIRYLASSFIVGPGQSVAGFFAPSNMATQNIGNNRMLGFAQSTASFWVFVDHYNSVLYSSDAGATITKTINSGTGTTTSFRVPENGVWYLNGRFFTINSQSANLWWQTQAGIVADSTPWNSFNLGATCDPVAGVKMVFFKGYHIIAFGVSTGGTVVVKAFDSKFSATTAPTVSTAFSVNMGFTSIQLVQTTQALYLYVYGSALIPLVCYVTYDGWNWTQRVVPKNVQVPVKYKMAVNTPLYSPQPNLLIQAAAAATSGSPASDTHIELKFWP